MHRGKQKRRELQQRRKQQRGRQREILKLNLTWLRWMHTEQRWMHTLEANQSVAVHQPLKKKVNKFDEFRCPNK
jgi:hypothetical protein